LIWNHEQGVGTVHVYEKESFEKTYFVFCIVRDALPNFVCGDIPGSSLCGQQPELDY
jgi:hypothetical protein